MINLIKEKIKRILETKIIRLRDGSYGNLYGESISSLLDEIEKLARDEEIKKQIKSETEQEILKEINELKLEAIKEDYLSKEEIYYKIKSWKEKLNCS